MRFTDRLFDYLEMKLREKKAEQDRLKKEQADRNDWYLVHTETSDWTYKSSALKTEYPYKVHYIFLENALGERKFETLVESPDNDKHKKTYLRDDFYILTAKPWLHGAKNILGIKTYEDARKQHMIDLLKK